jgi:hypothetical protein
MPKTYSNNPRSIRDFENSLRKGATVYVINTHALIPGQFERHTYSSHTCTGRNAITGNWMFGTTSAKSLICEYKQVFTSPPPGMRDLAGPEPDCRDEGYGLPRGWEKETRRLNRDELDHMDKRAREAADQYAEDRKAGRRGWGFR